MSDANVCFSVGGEEILKLEKDGPILLHGEEIANDETLYRDFMRRREIAEESPIEDAGDLPEDSPYGPGTITFQVTGEAEPLIRMDLGGIRVRGELTENPKKIVSALREFLDRAMVDVKAAEDADA